MNKIVRTVTHAKTIITMMADGSTFTQEYSGELSVRACKKEAAAENAEYVSMTVSKEESRYEMDIDTFMKYATKID